ncbi:MAG: hypothetical protein AAF429_00020 [Pseudomonadota bacterium]
MSNIEYLQVKVDPVIERASLQALQQRIGVDQSRDVLESTIFELSDRLWLLEKAFFEGALEDARQVAQSFCSTADEIGLIEFSKVASDLVGCIDRRDFVATQAVATRLVRVGETSLCEIVQMPEIGAY